MRHRIAATISLVALALSACSAVPSRRAEQRPGGADMPAGPAVAAHPDLRQCLADLGSSGARFDALADRYYSPGCQAVGAVRLDAVRGDAGSFQLANLGPVSCPLANTFAGWARYGVDRAARQVLGSALKRVVTMGSYACRNVAGTARLSAHSRAEAIDIGAFELADGRRISVQAGWNGTAEERRFLRLVYASACKRFGTVLGPDYNVAHRDHLHVEMGGGGFCR